MVVSVRLREIFFVLVLGYLSIELAINATLIDTVGRSLDAATLQNIQWTAEFLAALGPALILVQSFVFRDMAISLSAVRWRDLGFCTLIVAGCLFMLTPFEQWFAGRLVQFSSAEQRRSALVVTAGNIGILAGNYSVPDLGLSQDLMRDPATRTALLLFAPLAILGEAADDMREDAGPVIAGALFRSRGALQPIYESQRERFCAQFDALYRTYKKNSDTISRNWAFRILGMRKFREKRDEAFGYQAGLTPGLSREAFLRHPDIQGRIRQRIFSAVAQFPLSPQLAQVVSRNEMIVLMNDLFARKVLDPCLTWEALDREVIGPLLWRLREEIRAVAEGDRFRALAEGESLERVGRQAIYAVITPPLAVAWTLLAGIAGLVALTGLVLKSVLGVGRLTRSAGALVLLVLVAAWPYQHANPIADSEAFGRLKAVAIERSLLFGADVAITEWVLRAAPLVYPVGAFLRDYGPGVLLGLHQHGPAE